MLESMFWLPREVVRLLRGYRNDLFFAHQFLCKNIGRHQICLLICVGKRKCGSYIMFLWGFRVLFNKPFLTDTILRPFGTKNVQFVQKLPLP